MSEKAVIGEDVAAPLPGFGPAAPRARIETLDIVRGFALFCILVVNWSVNTLWDNDAWEGFSGAADQVAWWTIHLLLDEKARPMFTFLFGLGFAILMERARSRGTSFVPIYARRLAVLFVIGIAHDILTERDTLWSYAIFGFLLLPLRKLSANLLVVLALIFILAPFTWNAVNRHGPMVQYTDSLKARTDIPLNDPTVLDKYVGEYELEAEPYTIFITRTQNEFLAQSPGFPGWDDVPIRLFAESKTNFFSRSMDGARVSFVTDSTGTVTGLVWHRGRQDLSGRITRGGRQEFDDHARRRVASRDPQYRTYAIGSFGEIVSMRAQMFGQKFSSYASSFVRWLNPDFALFLLGLYAGRKRVFEEITTHRPFIRKVMWSGFALGLAYIGFATVMRDAPPGALFRGEPLGFTISLLSGLVERLASPALGLAYIAALTLLLERSGWKKLFAPLGAVGRMALTNYLLQSVAFVLLFFGYGLGWFGQVGAFGGLMLCLPVFALQIVGSMWWLRRFRFGPTEWLWRSLTYGKLQPLKIEQG